MLPEIRLRYDEATSTNDIGRQWALAGVGASALITAGHQTEGRGRRGARWVDTPGSCALMTFVVEPRLSIAECWKLSFVASLAALRACRRLVNWAAIALEWPNDLVFEHRKLAGVLVETAPLAGNRWVALIGIGINVRRLETESPRAFSRAAVSLSEIAGGDIVNVEDVVRAVSEEIEPLLRDCHIAEAWAGYMREWSTSVVVGSVQSGIDTQGRSVSGTLESVDSMTGEGFIRATDNSLVRARPSDRQPNE